MYLFRIVRRVLYGFLWAATGNKHGRGAYLCHAAECFQKAVKGRGLERSFKQAIPTEVYERLEKEMSAVDAR